MSSLGGEVSRLSNGLFLEPFVVRLCLLACLLAALAAHLLFAALY